MPSKKGAIDQRGVWLAGEFQRLTKELAQAQARVEELSATKPATMRHALQNIEMESREGGQWTLREINDAARIALGRSIER